MDNPLRFIILCIIDLLVQEVFNDTKITISGLSPVTTYKFHVWAENGVSNLTSSENRQFVDIAVTTTETSVKSASVNNVRVMLVKASEIQLSWDPPMSSFMDSGDGDDAVEVYEVSVVARTGRRMFVTRLIFFFLFFPRLFACTGEVLSPRRRVERQQ